MGGTGIFQPTSGPGDGIFIANHSVLATNRSGAATAIYECVMFDLAQSGTEVDNGTPGSSDTDGNNSGYNNYIDPALSTQAQHYIFGIAQEAIADDAVGEILIQGRTNALAASAVVAGDALTPAADGELVIATGVTDQKVVAIAEAVDATNVTPVLFDGIYGFGADVAT